jgi:pilus assembly protein CpaB
MSLRLEIKEIAMRNRNSLIFMGLAIVLGLTAAFIARTRFEQNVTLVKESIPTTRVVVVKSEIPVGTAITAQHLDLVEWPTEFAPEGAFEQPETIHGRVPRRGLALGEPVLETALLPVGSAAGLGALIGESRRAVSVKVDAVIGVAGFVTPGAHVDVLATLRRVDQAKPLPYSKVILENIAVLAIDQKLEDVGGSEPQLVSVVTLEVDPKQAQKLIYSAHEGHLQLALRNPGDNESINTTSVGVAEVLHNGKKAAPKRKARKRAPVAPTGTPIEVIKGTSVSTKLM